MKVLQNETETFIINEKRVVAVFESNTGVQVDTDILQPVGGQLSYDLPFTMYEFIAAWQDAESDL